MGNLVIAGHSMGGHSVARYAQKFPEKVSMCLPIAPVVSGDLHLKNLRAQFPEQTSEHERTGMIVETGSTGNIKHKPWGVVVEMQNHNLLPGAAHMDMPIFLYV